MLLKMSIKKILLFAIFVLLLFQSHAFSGSDDSESLKNKDGKQQTSECFEGVSRSIFSFNQGLDRAIFEPIAKGYRKLPAPIRTGSSNVVSNLSLLLTIPNNVLQGDLKQAGAHTARLLINSTIGILGILDPADSMGLQHLGREDYGQTLGTWGIGPGCYVVLPVLGPSTLRDTAGSFANVMGGDPWYNASAHGNNEFLSQKVYLQVF